MLSRILAVGASLAIVVAACGGSMNETEYVESLNDLVVAVGSEFETSNEAYDQIADPMLTDLVARIDRELVIEYAVGERFDSLDPPASVAEVNQVMVDTLDRLIAVAEDVVEVADTVTSLEELEQTPEFANYLAVNADADSMCGDVQDRINALAAGDEGFAARPWVVDLRLTVEAFLDCT